MKSDPTVSVIMPVYKVEDYVGAAIESIQAQTFSDFEFLIVDDGSPDNSGAICDRYAQNDDRIQVFHKENGGAPSARNYAMDRARGKYYYFMDSDDFAEPEMLADMVSLAENAQAQLVVAGFYIDTYYSEDKFRRDELFAESCVYEDKESFRAVAHGLFDKNLLYTPWNKLWLRSYIEERSLHFPQTFWDDFPFVLSVIRDAERIAVTDKAYYHFIRKRAESETAAYRSDMYEKREEEHGWMEELYAYWGVDSPQSREFLSRRYIERFIGCLENLTNRDCKMNKKEKKAEIRKMLQNPRVDEALKYAKPRSMMMHLMLIPIRQKSVFWTYAEAKTISFVKSRNTRIFAALKAGR